MKTPGKPAEIEIGPSLLLSMGVMLSSGAVLGVMFQADLPLWGLMVAAGVIVLSGLYHVQRDRCTRVQIEENGQVILRMRSGKTVRGQLQASSFVAAWLTILHVRGEGPWFLRRRDVLITPDAVDAECYRQLRVWLGWKCKPGAKSGL